MFITCNISGRITAVDILYQPHCHSCHNTEIYTNLSNYFSTFSRDVLKIEQNMSLSWSHTLYTYLNKHTHTLTQYTVQSENIQTQRIQIEKYLKSCFCFVMIGY